METLKKYRAQSESQLLAGSLGHFVLKTPVEWRVWDGACASPIRYDVLRTL
jgi:hypothetical protein